MYFFNGARTRRLNYDSAEEMFEVLRGDALRVSFEPEGEVSPLCPARPSSLILDRCREFEEISRATEAFITESQPSLAARPDLQRKASALLTKIDEARRISLPLLDR